MRSTQLAEKVTTVIGFVLASFGFLVVLAVLVEILDLANAPSLRSRAAERRDRWEARRVLAIPAPRSARAK